MPHHGFWDSIGRDLTGPGMFGEGFQLRLVIQPLIAIGLGVRFGLWDARRGRLLFVPARRASGGVPRLLLGGAARYVIIPLVVAFAVDGILQVIINGWFRPLVAVLVGALLVFLPFTIVRSAVNRIWTHEHPGAEERAARSR